MHYELLYKIIIVNNYRKIHKFLRESRAISSTAVGLTLIVKGRLMKEPIIPKLTTKIFGQDQGYTARGRINVYNKSKITNKNRRGSVTMTIENGQKFK